MGTAPDARQHPAMPDPERVVTRSVGMLEKRGIPRQRALYHIAAIARQVRSDLESICVDDLGWLDAIADAAERHLPVPDPKVTDH